MNLIERAYSEGIDRNHLHSYYYCQINFVNDHKHTQYEHNERCMNVHNINIRNQKGIGLL